MATLNSITYRLIKLEHLRQRKYFWFSARDLELWRYIKNKK